VKLTEARVDPGEGTPRPAVCTLAPVRPVRPCSVKIPLGCGEVGPGRGGPPVHCAPAMYALFSPARGRRQGDVVPAGSRSATSTGKLIRRSERSTHGLLELPVRRPRRPPLRAGGRNSISTKPHPARAGEHLVRDVRVGPAPTGRGLRDPGRWRGWPARDPARPQRVHGWKRPLDSSSSSDPRRRPAPGGAARALAAVVPAWCCSLAGVREPVELEVLVLRVGAGPNSAVHPVEAHRLPQRAVRRRRVGSHGEGDRGDHA